MNRRSSLAGGVVVALCLAIPSSLIGQDAPEIVPEWKVIGEIGAVRTVYVAPDGFRDKHFIAQVLQVVIAKTDQARPVQVMMFDDQRFTPQGLPMTDAQMLHLKAQYNRNPGTRLEKFVWISVVDSKSSPPKLKETEARIRPGFAG